MNVRAFGLDALFPRSNFCRKRSMPLGNSRLGKRWRKRSFFEVWHAWKLLIQLFHCVGKIRRTEVLIAGGHPQILERVSTPLRGRRDAGAPEGVHSFPMERRAPAVLSVKQVECVRSVIHKIDAIGSCDQTKECT